MKQLLALPPSTMIQAVRVECHLTAWNYRGLQASLKFWQRLNREGPSKISNVCNREIEESELNWASQARQKLDKLCAKLSLEPDQWKSGQQIPKQELRAIINTKA